MFTSISACCCYFLLFVRGSLSLDINDEIPPLTTLDIQKFRHSAGGLFRSMTYFDLTAINGDNSKPVFYVGGREYLYRFQLNNLSMVEKVHFPRSKKYYDLCLTNKIDSINKDEECQNQVWSVLFTPTARLIVCESQSYRPSLRYLHLEDLSDDKSESYNGFPGDGFTICDARASRQPGRMIGLQSTLHAKQVYWSFMRYEYRYTSNVNKLYKLGSHVKVFRSSVNRTVKYKMNDVKIGLKTYQQFNDAIFKNAIIVDNLVYIFYTDTLELDDTIKDPNSRNNIKPRISRIGRICKDDPGWSEMRVTYMTTFKSTTLSCGNAGTEYEILEDVVYDGEYFIATFTDRALVKSTAICRFKRSSADKILDGPTFNQHYEFQIDEGYNSYMNLTMARCPDAGEDNNRVTQYRLRCTTVYDKITADHLTSQQGVHFVRLLISSANTASSSNFVLFAFNDKSTIYKYSYSSANGVRLAVKYNTVDEPITDVKIVMNRIIGITENQVFSFLVEQCPLHERCVTCARDAQCVWKNHRCVAYSSRAGGQSIQNLGSNDLLEVCKHDCNYGTDSKRDVKMQGLPVTIPMSNRCTAVYKEEEGDRWYQDDTAITIGQNGYELSMSGTLLILNITKSAVFTLKRKNILLTDVHITVTDCETPDCHFRVEFMKWCTDFSNYKREYNNWQCLKDACIDDPTCIPTKISNTCPSP